VSVTRVGAPVGGAAVELRRMVTVLGLANRQDLRLEEIPLPDSVVAPTQLPRAAEVVERRPVGASDWDRRQFEHRQREDDDLRRLMNQESRS
ncbi:hypothetical protein, partial [Amycolatopsis vancoresmycina]